MMIDVRIFHLASHRISLSTVGVVPRLRQLKKDAPGVSLALSLHAPTQEIREKIVPSARVRCTAIAPRMRLVFLKLTFREIDALIGVEAGSNSRRGVGFCSHSKDLVFPHDEKSGPLVSSSIMRFKHLFVDYSRGICDDQRYQRYAQRSASSRRIIEAAQ